MTRQLEIQLHDDDLVVDGFAGGGGTSLGLERALGRSPDIAINHDREAINMHAENHPGTRHLHTDIHDVDPVVVTRGRRVGLAWFSPDCKHHSKAKGGRPRDKNLRDLAWVIVRWAKAVRPRVIMLENVEEFASWGPLDRNNQIIKSRKGETFRAWWRALEAEGYHVDMRLLRACNYGTPTIRKRLFVIARCDGLPIAWPESTHGPGTENPWRVAAECIQWEHVCPSIFERKRPLVDRTMRRIAKGMWKYVIDAGEPFIAPLTHAGDTRVHSLRDPMRTVTSAHRGEFGIVSPTLIQTSYGERPGQAPRVPGLHKPLGTVVAGGNKWGLVSAFLAKHYGERATGGWNGGAELARPFGTVTSRDHHSLVTSHIMKYRNHSGGRPMLEPLDTVLAGGWHFAEVRAFLTKYYGTRSCGQSLDTPAHTVTSRDRFGLITVAGADFTIGDIGMRMLQPRELYRAQGFPDSYRIDFSLDAKPLSKTAQIRMCGNSVPPQMAEALARANIVTRATIREAA